MHANLKDKSLAEMQRKIVKTNPRNSLLHHSGRLLKKAALSLMKEGFKRVHCFYT